MYEKIDANQSGKLIHRGEVCSFSQWKIVIEDSERNSCLERKGVFTARQKQKNERQRAYRRHQVREHRLFSFL